MVVFWRSRRCRALQTNDRVEHWMRRFRTDQRVAFQDLLERRAVYQGLVGDKLRDRGMPADLFSLAMIESWLVPSAVSSDSAVGLWQFTQPTAAQYGLRVDEWVDERRDPVRATDAALDYLAWLHKRYGSWYLAAAAYNAGPTRVDGVLKDQAGGRSGDEAIYWEVLEHLPLETREYVPRLVAATLVANDAEAHGFRVLDVVPYRYDRVFVPGSTTLVQVARALKVDGRVLRNLNPHLILGATPPGEAYPIRVPAGSSPIVMASLPRRTNIRRAD
jgi:membrane-bound lytic murein transglycosylase D